MASLWRRVSELDLGFQKAAGCFVKKMARRKRTESHKGTVNMDQQGEAEPGRRGPELCFERKITTRLISFLQSDCRSTR